MLGAKARAAEYNAAKAASARQASREAEEQKLPPKTTPVSLSAFTKIVSVNRNKGTKPYKPLVLSDSTEDDRSMSSLDLPLGDERTSSSPIMIPHFERPASLPSSYPLSFKHGFYGQDLFDIGYGGAPAAPRAMLSIDEHAVFGQNASMHLHPSPLLPLPQAMSGLLTYPMTPLQHGGWCFPDLEFSGPRHLQHFSNAGMPPAPPNSEPRVTHRHPLRAPEHRFHATHSREEEIAKFNPALSSTEKGVEGRRLQIFGPDNVSPTKIEIKEAYRRKWLEKSLDVCPSLGITSNSDDSEIDCSPEHIDKCYGQKSYLSPTHYHNPLRTKPIDCGKVRNKHVGDESSFRDFSTGSVTQQQEGTDIFGKSDSLRFQRELNITALPNRAPMPVALPLNIVSSAVIDKSEQRLLAQGSGLYSRDHRDNETSQPLSNVVYPRSRNMSFLRPMPDLDKRYRMENELVIDPFQIVKKYNTRVHYPLFDVSIDDWCDFNPLIAGEKERMREIMRITKASLTIDVDKSLFKKAKEFDTESHSIEECLKTRFEMQELRRNKVKQLADETQQKWQDAVSFGLPLSHQTNPLEAMRRVKAIGNAVVTLSQYADDFQEPTNPRIRSFATVPDYATERSMQLGREGNRSLFESDDGDSSTAPARIARDPRYRSRNMDLPVRSDNDKIARLLGGRSCI